MGQAAQMTESAEESSQTLGWTLREWEEYGNEMDIGHVNISKLNSRRRTDTVLISLAFILYLGVVFYVLSKRLPDPLRTGLLTTVNPVAWWRLMSQVLFSFASSSPPPYHDSPSSPNPPAPPITPPPIVEL